MAKVFVSLHVCDTGGVKVQLLVSYFQKQVQFHHEAGTKFVTILH